MRILMISHEYPPIGGGGANACRFLSRVFLRRGHEVSLVTVRFEDQPATDRDGDLLIYRLKARRKRKDSCSFTEMADFVMRALPFASSLVRKKGYDVCMIYFGIPSGVVGWYLKKRYSLPYVIRFGGGDIPGFQERFKAVYGLLSPFVKQIWKEAGALVANSSGLRSFALNFCDRFPVEVIPNGVDTDFFKIRTPGKEGQLRLVFVSRLLERKGLQYLIPHLKEIEDECGLSVTLTVVGDGPYRGTLEELCSQYQVLGRVRFMGQRDKEELPDFYADADLFVFPSKREGMPNAVLEAMASGLPVVMTPCEGAGELVDGNGAIVTGEYYKGLIEVIRSGQLEEMGRESLKRAKELFSWEASADKYLEIMEGLIQ